MRILLVLIGLALLVLILLMSFGFISLDQTQRAQLPKVNIEGGQAPEFEADVGRIDLGTTNRTVEVPTLEVEKAEGAEK